MGTLGPCLQDKRSLTFTSYKAAGHGAYCPHLPVAAAQHTARKETSGVQPCQGLRRPGTVCKLSGVLFYLN